MTTTSTPEPQFDAQAYVEQASRAIGLPIAEAYWPGVIRNMALVARMAGLVMGFPLGPADEPAPVFVPAEPKR